MCFFPSPQVTSAFDAIWHQHEWINIQYTLMCWKHGMHILQLVSFFMSNFNRCGKNDSDGGRHRIWRHKSIAVLCIAINSIMTSSIKQHHTNNINRLSNLNSTPSLSFSIFSSSFFTSTFTFSSLMPSFSLFGACSARAFWTNSWRQSRR